MPGFDQEQYVRGAHFESMSLAALLEEYRATRRATVLARVKPAP